MVGMEDEAGVQISGHLLIRLFSMKEPQKVSCMRKIVISR
jgi:hypothetical protein